MKPEPASHNQRFFEYAEASPPEVLREVVLSFWSFRATEHCPPTVEHTVWPDGCASLCVIMMPQVPHFAMCIQPRADARTTTVRYGSRYLGIRFWPDTAGAVFGIPAASIVDGLVPSEFSSRTSSLVAGCRGMAANDNGWSILERWCLDNVPHAVDVDPVVRAALRHIVAAEGGSRLKDIADVSGIGVRQLQRRFVDVTGLTIKAYSRVRRLRAALARQLAVKEPLSRTAAEGGYSDHAHLAREFTQLTGMAPTNVLRHLARIEHRNVVP